MASSSGICSRAGSTSRRRSSRRCSSRSRTRTRRSTGRWRPLQSSPAVELWETIAAEATRESALWAAALRPPAEQEREPVFSPLGDSRYALGLETIYEAYLLHFGPRSRLFAPPDPDSTLLLGDYLYAHGLVRIAAHGEVAAVVDLAELVSLCAYLRAEGAQGDGPLWAATAALLGAGELASAREALREDGDAGPLLGLAGAAAGPAAVEQALEAHAR